jgi:hypothetical protein
MRYFSRTNSTYARIMQTVLLEKEAAEAIEDLAKVLHRRMEHLDPSEDADWHRLSQRKRDFFRFCIEEILHHPRIIQQALNALDQSGSPATAR